MAKLAEFTFYCEVTYDRADIGPGMYTFRGIRGNTLGYNRLITIADKVWRQGPKGGVKIIKDRNARWGHTLQYVTTNEKIMKEFMWVKLQAQTYIKGA